MLFSFEEQLRNSNDITMLSFSNTLSSYFYLLLQMNKILRGNILVQCLFTLTMPDKHPISAKNIIQENILGMVLHE